jgi:hypothetical protein
MATNNIQVITITINIVHDVFKFFNLFNICVFTPLLHYGHILKYYFVFSLLNTPLKMAEKTKTCRRFTMCLYVTGYKYSTVVGIYRVYAKERCGFKS